jgi:hypothetical protein
MAVERIATGERAFFICIFIFILNELCSVLMRTDSFAIRGAMVVVQK